MRDPDRQPQRPSSGRPEQGVRWRGEIPPPFAGGNRRCAGRCARLAARRRGRRNDRAGQGAVRARPRRARPACRAPSAGLGARSRRRTGRRRARRWLRRSSRPGLRLAHNASGANLVSGVTSALLSARNAELGLFEVDEAALPEVARRVRPRAVCLGNLFRDQLDRYGELEHLAERWRANGCASCRRRRCSS